ncbi:hypothetical protein MJG53_006755 [Ovis ammon polii x Ovis aries]|uniref:Uncharacterized protein n=1 Tax=Ovis ammon polii x Ovis aries TaxID=2918886 RepID=A0ACB9V678_9CETA|nr:hypothetical protein MJG53_006755 [Ovis ammon polii x Ovis aries]
MKEMPMQMEGLQRSRYGTMAEGGIEHQGFEPSSSLRIILVSKTGSRNSATGKSILCQPMFESKLRAQSVTRKCQRATGMWNGRTILVVDTPPIFEAEAQDQEVYENIGACYLLSAPGPHVLLLLTQLGRFTEQDVVAVTRVKEAFGAGAESYMVTVFTHQEDLTGGSLDESGGKHRQPQAEEPGPEVRVEMLRHMGSGTRGEGQRCYLDKVRLQVAKQKQELKEAERN